MGPWTATPSWLIFHIYQYNGLSARQAAPHFPPRPPNPWDDTLWASKSTGGTVWRLTPDSVSDFEEISPPIEPLGYRVYFSALDQEHGQELWVTDGTPDGTHLFADLVPGEGSSYPDDFMVFQGKSGSSLLVTCGEPTARPREPLAWCPAWNGCDGQPSTRAGSGS